MRLPKSRRIVRSGDFRRVREEGESFRGRYLILGVLPDDRLESIKVGFITTKRLGNAVTRVLVRRRLRSVLIEVGDRIKPGHYLVTIARPQASKASFEALKKEWKWLGHRAKLFLPKESCEPSPAS